MSFKHFPEELIEIESHDKNPAIQLLGRRFFIDQTISEYLVEFLLVVSSPKRVAEEKFLNLLPPWHILIDWPSRRSLEYAPKSRLNLKMFAFFSSSKIDTRHKAHREHYHELIDELEKKIQVVDRITKPEVLRTLENLFLGFQGAGIGRTWCAQSFLPICNSLIAGETIWNETEARKHPPETWEETISFLHKYFAINKHRFLGRGGELLYLQICNALRQSQSDIKKWNSTSNVGVEPNELDPEWLHNQLEISLIQLLNYCPEALGDIADFIDSKVEEKTSLKTDMKVEELRYTSCTWCPVEGWREGYLFAVELFRLCTAEVDLMEKLQLIETACIMQVIRSLCSQSTRYIKSEFKIEWPSYRLAVSNPESPPQAVKRISQHTVKTMEKFLFKVIRSESVVKLPEDLESRKKLLKEADKRYASKLFLSLAKRIGLLIPRRGPGLRFTLNERLLRYLVMTTVPINGRLTFDKFKEIVEARHGLVFDSAGLSRASSWTDNLANLHLPSDTDNWLQDMLEAAGFLIRLSDSCALVVNTAGNDN